MEAIFLVQANAPAGSSSLGLLMLLAVFAIFYFLLIMPVQRRQKKTAQMQRDLKPGDRILTRGGLRAIVVSVKDDALIVRVAPDQVKLELLRGAVDQLLPDDSGK